MMGSAGITNVGPINTPTTGQGAIAGVDPIMKFSKRATKKRKKMESAGKQWNRRRNDPTYIDGRSKTARNLIKRLAKRRKKMSEETILEAENSSSSGGGETTKAAYKFIAQKRKVQKKQEREKRAANRKQEIQMISRAKATDYQKKAKARQGALAQQLQKQAQNNSYSFDGLTYLESLADQLAGENPNPVFYFFNDETELEVTSEMAEQFLARFGELSEENMEKFMSLLPESADYIVSFMQM
jgi:hypothetical protein